VIAINDAAAANGGRINALLACAGTSMPKRFKDTPASDFERLMQVNYLGNVYACQAALPFLEAAGNV
jgi:3-dehydrosphinganine reductase